MKDHQLPQWYKRLAGLISVLYMGLPVLLITGILNSNEFMLLCVGLVLLQFPAMIAYWNDRSKEHN